MCNENGKAAVVLMEIPRKGVRAHVISAQDVEKYCKENLLAYCKRPRINAGRVRSAAYCRVALPVVLLLFLGMARERGSHQLAMRGAWSAGNVQLLHLPWREELKVRVAE
jgi:hypothetical protein